MHPRTMGPETEWATIATEHGRPLKDFWETVGTKEIFVHCFPPGLAPIELTQDNHFLENGAMARLDTGLHFEYAGPEVLFARDNVICEKAGDRFVEIMTANINARFQERGIAVSMYKQNRARGPIGIQNGVEVEGDVSYGAHESYLMERHRFNEKDFFWRYAPFRVTAQLYTGNGYVYRDCNGKLSYELSQRAGMIVKERDGATTNSRAILNTRDEPLCGTYGAALHQKYRRLHVIMGDANIAEVALFLKYGTTDIVLEMIEAGFLADLPWGTGWNILDMLHQFSEDSGLRSTCTIGGKSYSIIDMQEIYWLLAKKFFDDGAGEYTDERKEIMSFWETIIVRAKLPRPHERLASLTDWAAKKLHIERDGERLGYAFGRQCTERIKRVGSEKASRQKTEISDNKPDTVFNRAKLIDLQYHRNDPRGIAHILNKNGTFVRVVRDEEIEVAIFAPISAEGRKTRAFARAEQLRWIKGHIPSWDSAEQARGYNFSTPPFSLPFLCQSNWDKVVLYNGQTFDNTDPFNADPRIPPLCVLERPAPVPFLQPTSTENNYFG